tara:strand:+ start:1080 stop:1496 length:417 start_codon:yes stop_codon:yes gene_type:complete
MAVSSSFGPNGFGVGDVRASGYNGSASGTFRCIRSKEFSHGGSSFTRSVHVQNDFALNPHGGYLYYAMHGWVNEFNHGLVRWNNPGNGSGITAIAKNEIASTGLNVSMTHDGDKTITFNVTGAHSNGHGFMFFVWCGQ